MRLFGPLSVLTPLLQNRLNRLLRMGHEVSIALVPSLSLRCKMRNHMTRYSTISKLTERNRLRMVLKNLSLLRLLKNSNPRIQELYSLARRCWNSLLNVPKVLLISSRNNTVCTKMGQNNEGLQEAKCSKKKLKSKNLGKPKELNSKVRVPEKKKVQQSRAAVPEGEQVEPEVPKTSMGHGLITCPGAWGRQLPTGDPGVIFLKTHRGDMEQLEVADQWNWFEGLPRRIHLQDPG
ncbi:hypothetical protein QTO34_002337 [Cnephaeus nilssonii]|uniref:TP53-target gene 5 protein n=1 Tax=Cnephaeus nilssonii TaxID=3371016 RepID=A0AA40HUP2_CNENI|nr:hypothetical protein QTO34_002337 [Eptesicus nilssonii]